MSLLTVGDPVPWFSLPSTSNPKFHFDTVGGHRVVMFFLGSAQHHHSASLMAQFAARQAELARLKVPFFGISLEEDARLAALVEQPTYFKLLWDVQGLVSQRYGVLEQSVYTPTTFVLDETLRVLQVFPVVPESLDSHVAQVIDFLAQLPASDSPAMAIAQAPVLLIPRVFDPDFCRYLIQLFETDGGEDSGFMREQDGKTVAVYDYGFKKRRDFNLERAGADLMQTVNNLVLRRVKPEIEKVYQFTITRFERHVIGCYEAENQGFFNRHRDNTTRGTAHRQFAMTINLNTGDYEGGCLWFPEYGTRLFRPGVGEAVIFSCSLLHEVTPVIEGRRYALLSFFYNDAAAQIREKNRQYLADPKNAGAE